MTSSKASTGSARVVRSAFDRVLREHGVEALVRGRVTTLQVNVGKLCNQACHHCHVDAGPLRKEMMTSTTARRVIELLQASPSIETVDITGGAPELCPSFEELVLRSRALGKRVIDRCNLTVLLQPGREYLARFLADNGVAVVASMPCYLQENVDRQRGTGVFEKSLDALERLNALGYGRPNSSLELDLVYNPGGPQLPPQQEALEADYKRELGERYGIEFHRLFTLTNMPIRRFADELQRTGMHEAYMSLLVNHFNAATVPALMCRSLVSVSWDGQLHDCDFNQMLELPLHAGADLRDASGRATIHTIDSLTALEGGRITTARHCFGCTAGAGSSCGGALA